MSKGLEALNYIYQHWNCNHPTHCSGIEKHFNTIEKELKALEIIKENFKPYDIEELKNGMVRIWLGHDHYVDLSQDKYDLLKEVLL